MLWAYQNTVTTATNTLRGNQTLGLCQTEIAVYNSTCPATYHASHKVRTPVQNIQAYLLSLSQNSVLLMLSGASLQFSQKHTIRPYPKPVKSEVHKSLPTQFVWWRLILSTPLLQFLVLHKNVL